MKPEPLSFGGSIKCVSVEQRPDRYMAWIVTFEDWRNRKIEMVPGWLNDNERPHYEVGKWYSFKITTEGPNT